MREPVNIKEIIELVEKQEPDRQDIILALTNAIGGYWESNAYYRFVNSKNANEKGAEWQFEENIVLKDEKLGTIILDYLKNKQIGGIEFLEYID